MRLLDVFCGCGGLSLGAHLAGFETAFAIDNDPKLVSSYSLNFPKSKIIVTDLQKRDPTEFLTTPVDGVIGGPPCQGFSIMGRKNPKDSRNELFERFFEIVKQLQPRFFVMENVPGLLSSTHADRVARATQTVTKLYHLLGPSIFDSADFGAPTTRPRAIIIGFRKNMRYGPDWSELEALRVSKVMTVRDAINDLPSPRRDAGQWGAYKKPGNSEFATRMRALPGGGLGTSEILGRLKHGEISGLQFTSHSEKVRKRFSTVVPGGVDQISKYKRLDWKSPAPVLRAGTGPDRGSFQAARPIHPAEDRVISVREAARLQGFPDWFQFHETKWHSHRMIGNSVSPFFSEAIFRFVTKVMK